jgi:hypothetical protein
VVHVGHEGLSSCYGVRSTDAVGWSEVRCCGEIWSNAADAQSGKAAMLHCRNCMGVADLPASTPPNLDAAGLCHGIRSKGERALTAVGLMQRALFQARRGWWSG